jgi:metal-responsive CopG/Arc/MetJ family transcriptional regulator
MGRPPKYRIATLIRLDKTALARIDRALVKKEKRVDLIRAAVERELARREKKHYKGPRS